MSGRMRGEKMSAGDAPSASAWTTSSNGSTSALTQEDRTSLLAFGAFTVLARVARIRCLRPSEAHAVQAFQIKQTGDLGGLWLTPRPVPERGPHDDWRPGLRELLPAADGRTDIHGPCS